MKTFLLNKRKEIYRFHIIFVMASRNGNSDAQKYRNKWFSENGSIFQQKTRANSITMEEEDDWKKHRFSLRAKIGIGIPITIRNEINYCSFGIHFTSKDHSFSHSPLKETQSYAWSIAFTVWNVALKIVQTNS